MKAEEEPRQNKLADEEQRRGDGDGERSAEEADGLQATETRIQGSGRGQAAWH
jgi:hypothetical protein